MQGRRLQQRYLRDAWYMACWDRDLLSSPLAVTVLGEPIALYRTDAGQVVGMEDRCPHRMAPLSLGRCEGARLRCMYHGLLFNPDGTCAEIPGQNKIPPATRVPTYAVVEQFNAIWVWMGEAENADPSMLPDFKGYGHSDWAMEPGHMDYYAPANLIHDNLLDLSHVGYVHANSFAGGSDRAAEAWVHGVTNVETIARGVRVVRWMPNSPPVRAGGAESDKSAGLADAFARTDFVAPGILLQLTGRYPVGTAARVKGGEPDVEPSFSSFTCQAVTPLTNETARYFFAFGPDRRFPNLKASFHELALKAFAEDKVIIEAQRRVLEQFPDRKMLPLNMDKAVLKYEGVLRQLQATGTNSSGVLA